MKIDFVINSLVPGGAEKVLILLANYFDEKGHEVTIITFNEPEIFKPNKTIKRVRLHHGKIKNHMIRSYLNLIGHYSKKSRRPDILMSYMIHTNLIATLVSRFYKIKLIAAEHTNHLSATDFIGRFTRKYAYKYVNALTVLTKFDRDFYESFGVKAFLMPNPSTFSIFYEEKRNREKVILAVSVLDKYHIKGFDNLIELIAPILKKHKDWKLKLVGGGTKGTNYIKELCLKNGIENSVIFVGYSDNVAEIMQKSEIYIMTSRREGLPMVLIEAMSQGMTCISYNCTTGPSEIINHDHNGILVEDQNHELMAVELEKLIVDEEKRELLAQNATKSLDRFEIEKIYKDYMIIFDKLIHG
ncbi:glycosyltransferase family 4 protein [Winogradskyella poriferorum]|uniref:glycosyltransferase family 4 protein n=1 Tax=Winogradskyella poriferorum TaxID=307627 RepID=UPI003D660F78